MSEENPITYPPFPEIPGVEFRHCPGHPGYAATNDGSVWSCRTSKPMGRGHGSIGAIGNQWRRRKAVTHRDGHLLLALSRNGKATTKSVHRLVIETFVGPRPDGMECCHNDGNPANNRLDNLRWDTSKNNNADKLFHGTSLRGDRHPSAKFTERQILEIRSLYAAGGLTQKQIAGMFGTCQSTIGTIVRGVRWKHIACSGMPQTKNANPRRGERNPQSKLTARQVCGIRTLVIMGIEQRLIAKAFGSSDATVSRIVNGLSWQHTNG